MRFSAIVAAMLMTVVPAAASAQAAFSVPDRVQRATAYVVCGSMQGSGMLTNAERGYVITAGHVAIDAATGQPPQQCAVGFIDDSGRAEVFLPATVERSIFNARTDRDFAVLKLTPAALASGFVPREAIRTNEYATPGDSVAALGFPSANRMLHMVTGVLQEFSRGSLRTDVPIAEGYSGGPAVDASGNAIGVAERITYTVDEETGAKEPVRFEMGDILNLIRWLDGDTADGHDDYLLHHDHARYHFEPYHIRDESSGCAYAVRTADSPAVSCLTDGSERLIFPNAATFASWFPAGNEVLQITPTNLAEYRLVGNMTMKPGSLVKITTDPKVYLVTDSFGGMSWVPTEERAIALFGADWASKVKDVPDAFFTDYFVGAPIAP